MLVSTSQTLTSTKHKKVATIGLANGISRKASPLLFSIKGQDWFTMEGTVRWSPETNNGGKVIRNHFGSPSIWSTEVKPFYFCIHFLSFISKDCDIWRTMKIIRIPKHPFAVSRMQDVCSNLEFLDLLMSGSKIKQENVIYVFISRSGVSYAAALSYAGNTLKAFHLTCSQGTLEWLHLSRIMPNSLSTEPFRLHSSMNLLSSYSPLSKSRNDYCAKC